MLTEAEAKTKACPLTFCITGGSFGGGSIMPGPRNCIASACMAWRWVEQSDRVEHENLELFKPKGELNPPFSNCPDGFEVTSHGSDGIFQCRREVSRLPPRGYCGAFGRQEE